MESLAWPMTKAEYEVAKHWCHIRCLKPKEQCKKCPILEHYETVFGKAEKKSNIDSHKTNNKAMKLEKTDLLEWGWHKTGDPSNPKGGFLWANPDYPEFYVMYDEFEGCAYVLYRYAKGGSDACNSIAGIHRFMDIHKGYEHEQGFGL